MLESTENKLDWSIYFHSASQLRQTDHFNDADISNRLTTHVGRGGECFCSMYGTLHVCVFELISK